ncbi:MAG: glutamate--tRNA ligase [Candidatus Puniceispirillales bacterium]
MNVITRFAPSPTGYLHIGGARTALFNYLFARRFKGKFLLRIEDTDKVRSTNEAIEAINTGLEWLNLVADDEIIYQSKNLNKHKLIAERLLKTNKAYKCFLSNDEQTTIRNNCLKNGLPFRSPWRDKKNYDLSLPYVVRIKMPDDGLTELNDIVQGDVRVSNKQLDDFVLLRSNGLPTYMLAVVVDDYDMGITHIIRGDDHLNNAFRQFWIYKALDWKVPAFAHIPLIHGEDGAKLSKRHGALGIEEYKEMGFLSESINSYLMNLGWREPEKDFIDLDEASKIFELNKIGKSSSRFNIAKLKNINSHFMRSKNQKSLINLIKEKIITFSPNFEERLIKVLPLIIERAETINDIINSINWLNSEDYTAIFKEKNNFENEEIEFLKLFIKSFSNCKIESKSEMENHFNKWLSQENIKMKQIGKPLRLSLTGRGSSIDLISILDVLGVEEIKNRINYNLNNI